MSAVLPKVIAICESSVTKEPLLKLISGILENHAEINHNQLSIIVGGYANTNAETAERIVGSMKSSAIPLTINLKDSATGLDAVYQGYKSIRSNECDYAIACIAEHGRSVVVLLKSKDAIVAGDKVHALLKYWKLARHKSGNAARISHIQTFMNFVTAHPARVSDNGDVVLEPMNQANLIYTISAASPDVLQAKLNQTKAILDISPAMDVDKVCKGSNLNDSFQNTRKAICIKSTKALREQLEGTVSFRLNVPGKVAYLCSLADPPNKQVLEDLLLYPAFRDSFARLRHVDRRLAFQIASCALWKSWGITPDALIGLGSCGEMIAAVITGSMTTEDANALVSPINESVDVNCLEVETVDLASPLTNIEAIFPNSVFLQASNSQKVSRQIAMDNLRYRPSAITFDRGGQNLQDAMSTLNLPALRTRPLNVRNGIEEAIEQGYTTFIDLDVNCAIVRRLWNSNQKVVFIPPTLDSGDLRTTQAHALATLYEYGYSIDWQNWHIGGREERLNPIEKAVRNIMGSAGNYTTEEDEDERSEQHQELNMQIPTQNGSSKQYETVPTRMVVKGGSQPKTEAILVNGVRKELGSSGLHMQPSDSRLIGQPCTRNVLRADGQACDRNMHLRTVWIPEDSLRPDDQDLVEYTQHVPVVHMFCQGKINNAEKSLILDMTARGIQCRVMILDPISLHNADNQGEGVSVSTGPSSSLKSFQINASPTDDIVVMASLVLVSEELDWRTPCRSGLNLTHALLAHRSQKRRISCFWLAHGAALATSQAIDEMSMADTRICPGAASLFGFVKVVRRELWRHSIHIAMDIKLNPSASMLVDDMIAIHLRRHRASPVLYSAKRLVPRLVETPQASIPDLIGVELPASVTNQFVGTWLCVGGLGDVLMQISDWLRDRMGASHLVLVGRRPGADAEIVARLAKLKMKTSCKVSYISANISRREEVAAVLENISLHCPPLVGILFGPQIMDDRPVARVDFDSLEKVAQAKCDGSIHLHELTKHMTTVRHFIMLSSLTSTVGNPTQTAYTVGNYFLNAVATKRRMEGLPALAIELGAIEGSGMIDAISRPVPGMTLWANSTIPAAMEILEWIYVNKIEDPVQVIGVINKEAARNNPSCRDDPFFSEFIST